MNFDPLETSDIDLFVFPLPKVVLFPSTAQPLNIFEPRYIEMIKDAIKLDRPIALTNQGRVGGITGVGRPQILEERSDGTMMILVRCDCKARLTSLDQTSKPYWLATATTIIESTDLDPGNVFYLRRMTNETIGWLERHIPQPKKRAEFLEQMGSDEERVNTACSLLIEDSDWLQRLLEMNDLNERLKAAAALLETGAASH